ncbi:hypothetical protein Lal_00006129 [Lupinus albus]|nr:hypothetical protein Lal_00006129 [Lupinus albus]
MKGGVGEDDMCDGMQCIDHPFRNNNNNNGGICAICLQEKLAKLVSSSFPLPIPPSTSSSSSPSFSSNNNIPSTSSSTIRPSPSISLTTPPPPPPSTATSLPCPTNGTQSHHHHHQCCTRRARIPFLLPKKKKKPSPTPNNSNNVVILKRSKSTATPSSRGNFSVHDADHVHEDLTSNRKRNGFWSFLYLSSNSKSSSSTKKLKSKSFRDPTRISSTINVPNTSSSTTLKAKEKCKSEVVVVVEDDNNSCNSNTTTASATSSFERKVSRSRSVGCGSRSFSGDFFERISTGFGDCTLRRVESQREGKTKVNHNAAAATASGAPMNRERVRCGGLFSGFMMTSSSSSSSSSSSYWVSSSATENNNNDTTMNNGKSVTLSHGRAKTWAWAFASPMRAFTTKPSSKDNRRDIVRDANHKNATPNLSAIPSLLSATG